MVDGFPPAFLQPLSSKPDIIIMIPQTNYAYSYFNHLSLKVSAASSLFLVDLGSVGGICGISTCMKWFPFLDFLIGMKHLRLFLFSWLQQFVHNEMYSLSARNSSEPGSEGLIRDVGDQICRLKTRLQRALWAASFCATLNKKIKQF